MADWTGEGMRAAEQYRQMAERAFAGVSPSYQALAFAVAVDDELCARLDARPPRERQPNLLFGAARWWQAPTGEPAAFLAWVHTHWDDVVDVLATHRTQTNEAGRCATLLPALAQVAGPVALVEVGASAGLCLLPDRYAYRYRTADGVVGVGVGVGVGDGTPTLECDVTGPAPMPTAVPEIVWRRGLDLHPLDAGNPDDARWLQALVWPEQTGRFAVLQAALAVAQSDPPVVVAGDLLTDLAGLVHEAPVDTTVVVMHSAVLAYLGPDDRRRFVASLSGFDREVVWLSNEAPGVVVDADPTGHDGWFLLARDGVPLAWTGPHGERLDWTASAPTAV